MNGKINLLNLERPALAAFFAALGEPRFRADQLCRWIHQRGVCDFDRMTDMGKALRARLREHAEVVAPRVVRDEVSADGTRKWLLGLGGDGEDEEAAIEMVYIPQADRGTLCVSSQVGCILDCSFCATARQGFNRNLGLAEIVGQVWLAHRLLSAFRADEGGDQNGISNIIFMGMGEPLYNYKNVLPAARLCMDDFAYGLSGRRVTVSTAGVVPRILQLVDDDCDAALAVSLHAPDDALRDELVPLNRRYPLAELMAACKKYTDARPRRHVTMEYVMLAGVNDQPAHARMLVKRLSGLPAKVNLIPFNPFPGAAYRCSDAATVQRFGDMLNKAGVVATTRKPRGRDIAAACGQLAGRVRDRARRVAVSSARAENYVAAA